jgi:hypothetical protein
MERVASFRPSIHRLVNARTKAQRKCCAVTFPFITKKVIWHRCQYFHSLSFKANTFIMADIEAEEELVDYDEEEVRE